MSRIIAFHYYCDNGKAAKHLPRTVEGDTVLVYSPKQEQTVELDVCDECLSHLTYPEVTALADVLGREIVAPEFDPELVCPHGCQNSMPFKNKAGKTRHMTRKHPGDEEA